MEEGLVSDKQLIEALLRERDELYRRAIKAERRLEELSDAESMRQQYETRIKEMEASHEKQVSVMKVGLKSLSRIRQIGIQYTAVLSMATSPTPSSTSLSRKESSSTVKTPVLNSIFSPFSPRMHTKALSLCTSRPHTLFIVVIFLVKHKRN